VKLHFGCGKRFIPGWIHVDAVRYPHVDVVADLRSLSCFSTESATVVYACSVLEHFSMKETPSVLKEWQRILCSGGVLRLSVPDIKVLASLYLSGVSLEPLKGMIVGGQRDQWDFHKNVFDETRLTSLLNEAGFIDVRHWDWRLVEHAAVDDYSRAYYPHLDFEHGVNTSLNLEATKP